MIRIEINNEEDINKCQLLNKQEDYYFFVNLPYMVKADAIDLTNFCGRIYLSLDNISHKLRIRTTDVNKSFLFFESVKGKNLTIVLGNTRKYKCEYEEKIQEIIIRDERELKGVCNLTGKVNMILDNDIIVHGNEKFAIGDNISIIPNHYHIYCPVSMKELFQDNYGSLIKYYDQNIVIKKEKDIDKLYSIEGHNVVVEFRKDISNITMHSVEVSSNVKELFVFGQNHTISDVVIVGSVYNGLFSTIPASTSLLVSDLNFRNVHLVCDKNVTERAGLVFGSHGLGRVHGYPEPVEIRNCSFRENVIDACKLYVGVISGSDHGETKVVDCKLFLNTFRDEEINEESNGSIITRLFGAHEVKKIIYCSENGEMETSWKASNNYEKRLVRKK